MKKYTIQQNSSYEWAIFKFSEFSLKIKSEKNFANFHVLYYNKRVLYHSSKMNQEDRDFKKVLETLDSLETKITNLESFVKEALVNVHELSKKDITHQYKVNIDTCKQIGEIIDLISAQSDAIQALKNGQKESN
tara:strand:- start:50 stop:451 length:402 start_codon:yes stop_codon:yes gene_type:complete